jgi:hypothetical protein
MGIQIWRKIPGRILHLILHLFSFVCLMFEGYNQGKKAFQPPNARIFADNMAGVLGEVSGTRGFISMADIGADGVVTNSTKQGFVPFC